jgi:HD-like signal output (HDOD) protein
MIADLLSPPSAAIAPDDIVRDLKHVPSAPKVLPRLKQLLGDGNSSMREIVMLIRLDPGIAARVLQMGNSAYFSKGVRCFTVEEAVNRVGYEQIYELVSYAVAAQVLVRPLDVYGIEADDLWQLSVSCALASEILAERSGQDRDVAYTVGLLHCLGMVAIDDWALRHRPDLTLPSAGLPREAAESEFAALGFTQAEAGAALLRLWGFPHAMCEPVRWQYAPRAGAAHIRMACLLHCAKWLRTTVCAKPGELRPAQPLESALQMVPLHRGDLPGLVAEVEGRLQEVRSLLDIGQRRELTAHRFPEAAAAGLH